MSDIFLKKLHIKNYKCFKDHSIELQTPNGAEGSGLNIFIGENGKGKTSVLEAIDFLTQSQYASENRMKIDYFNKYDEEICVSAETDEFVCNMDFPYKGTFECKGIEFIAKNRTRKSPGKLLSSTFQVTSKFTLKTDNYLNQDGTDSGKEVPPLLQNFSNGSIKDGELNIFYFDNNRNWQISTGTYKTTFERICDDLNWKFVKNLSDEMEVQEDGESEEKKVDIIYNMITDKIDDSYFNNVLEIAQKGVGEKLAKGLKDFFNNKDYDKLRIDILKFLSPFSSAFFSVREDKSLQQITTKELGSGIEMILTLLLLKSISEQSKGSIIYLIDEPELHLHPKAQDKLIDLLVKESKDKQIIVSTHSPYIFKNTIHRGVGLKLFKEDKGKIVVEDARDTSWGVLPWSPSWGEINYRIYNVPSVEFHNELYGYLQEKESLYKEKDVESFLNSKSISKSKQWIRERDGTIEAPYDVTLCTYVRNKIHHPDNTNNSGFSEKELEDSIVILLSVIT
ncbi:AAA family ATPase [Patescibacteria group bacterium]